MAKVICFINMKGGVAKTTLAVNFADYLNRTLGQRVLVIDVDPQFNATQCFMSPDQYQSHVNDDGGTVLNIFDDSSSLEGDLVEGIVTGEGIKSISPISVRENLDLIPGNLDLYRLEVSPGAGTENLLKVYINTILEDYDTIVIDTPPTPSVWLTSALIAADNYVIPVKPEPLSLTGIGLLNGLINKRKRNFALDIVCSGIVMTMVETNTTVYKEFVASLEATAVGKQQLLKEFLPKRTSIPKDQRIQKLILDGNDVDLKTALANVAKAIIERMGYE